jgi:uncharacterized OB-fold protein
MKIPSPPINPENKAFFDAARDGKFMLGRCKSCKEFHYYPRAVCPFCSGPAELVPAKGRGKVYSYSVMRRVAEPYAIAYVALDEGVTVLTNLVDCDPDKIRIDQSVKVVFKAAEGGETIPMFTPA